jgi:hypothetical protein
MVQVGWSRRNCSVPAKGILGHDWCRYLLCPNAAPLTAAASMTASTAGGDPTVASAMHPGCCTARNRTICHAAARARDRARTLVSSTLLLVPASNEEHGGTIGESTSDRATSNTGS